MKQKIKYLLFIIVGCILLDQILKFEITSHIQLNGNITIIKNFLKLTNTQNDGAAFGLFSGNTLFLIIISLIILLYLIYEIKKSNDGKTLISYSLIIGGLIGNLIDRIFFGYVRDFISFTLFGKNMAIFNIADSCLVIGTILLIVITIWEGIHENKNRKR